MIGVMSLYRADGRPPVEEVRPPAMIADRPHSTGRAPLTCDRRTVVTSLTSTQPHEAFRMSHCQGRGSAMPLAYGSLCWGRYRDRLIEPGRARPSASDLLSGDRHSALRRHDSLVEGAGPSAPAQKADKINSFFDQLSWV